MFSNWEWLVVGAVTLVIILWGPSKFPQLAKALSRARGENRKASIENHRAATKKPAANIRIKTQTSQSRDDLLVETAQRLGVSTNGKSREELTKEIR